MLFLYNLAIRGYYFLALVVSAFNKKAKLWLDGRKDWDEHLESVVSPNFSTAWFHCASLGEFEQGRPLIEAYRNHYPGHKILLTFFSPSGFEIRKNYPGADYVCYLPLDTKRNAKQFLSIVKPVIAVFVKYEFWYHFLNQLHKQEIPTYVVSANFRPGQVFFKWYGGWYRKFLKNFDHIFVQDRNSLMLLQRIGIDKATSAGDTRFDRVYETAKKSISLPLLEEFSKNATVLVAGSTWPRDEELIAYLIKHVNSKVKIILAPHEIDSQRIEKFRSSINIPSIRFTQPSTLDASEVRLLVIDTIGLLASAYSYGNMAYVGGGFGVGIHNTLEPATFGIPVIFGPNYQKFREAVDLIENKAAFCVTNEKELYDIIENLLSAERMVKEYGNAAKRYVQTNIGATKKILGIIEPKIKSH